MKYLIDTNIFIYIMNQRPQTLIQKFKDTEIGPLDLLIAAHALSRNLILVTNNEKEFKRIESLNFENWSV